MADNETVAADHGHDGAHVTERQYWFTFVALAVLTAIEIYWSYTGLSGAALILPLVGMMVVKFLLVAGVFMHLYFDTKILHGRIFWLIFASSIVLALAVYVVIVATFHWAV